MGFMIYPCLVVEAMRSIHLSTSYNRYFVQHFDDYELVDSGNFRKLERIGRYLLVRPAAGAVWRPKLSQNHWAKADAEFKRTSASEGDWSFRNQPLPQSWCITTADCRLQIQPTPFGHIGLFPEHLVFERLRKSIASQKDFHLLNLFAYTGVSSIAAAKFGAKVTHVDASRKSVHWARTNASLNPEMESIRWICDDARDFVKREIRRGRKYHGIILDPPTFGRSPTGKTWKIDEDLPALLDSLAELCSQDLCYLQLTCHTPGYTQATLKNLVQDSFSLDKGITANELTLKEKQGRELPGGTACYYINSRSGQ